MMLFNNALFVPGFLGSYRFVKRRYDSNPLQSRALSTMRNASP
jgi:hypothetical protein